jgi:hypothetical protein
LVDADDVGRSYCDDMIFPPSAFGSLAATQIVPPFVHWELREIMRRLIIADRCFSALQLSAPCVAISGRPWCETVLSLYCANLTMTFCKVFWEEQKLVLYGCSRLGNRVRVSV